MRQFPLIFLWMNSALFIGFGIIFTFSPVYFTDILTGTSPGTPSAMIDLRANYGGMAFGIGTFLIICARNAATVRLGLILAIIVTIGLAGCRTVGIVLDGSPNTLMLVTLAVELLFVAITGLAIKGAPKSELASS